MPTADRSPHHPDLTVQRLRGAFRVTAAANLPAGTQLLTVTGRVTDRPSRDSIQIGAHEHIDPPVPDRLEDDMDRHAWRFLNHSCEANAVLRGLTLVALRDIAAGAEITFDYATTEYEMAEPFVCGCGAPTCRGVIRGFAGLNAAQRLALLPHLAAHLRLHAATANG
jgi:hypothetical protein